MFGVFAREGRRVVPERLERPGAPRVVIKGLALFGAVVAKPKAIPPQRETPMT
ncbi:hypothetical protein [Streptomyces barringtoniae]|uniref:hypothetical protein n=1 Tax=Streptomyces barringtoniae TaxID=2892029 RepID=UPI001E54BCD7|nr:hypothetical protein [Streptomyces barringtoniae]MCC5480652.1 hypothetical protein [Streptomyces barringtoniae]